ncbi:TorF family putative porin [Phenylobacterium sp. J367]|uniref:TorF family putative porin n=1 Tax=Phenylobacterium sp. J367 TaxID=2898435 RepID=UPI0021509487|nr:TorF family putative porin [Phenylobacterium sp. J367]MCR5879389.1 TorF family putative porin [Phenylobacterium sp. J367]
MKALKLALLGAVGALALAGTAQAQEDAGPISLSFNVGAASDYVFRGISQTDEDPQIFGGVDATIGSIGYAGVWASNVEFNNGTDLEFDIYGGIKPTVGAVTFDIGLIYYGYVDSPPGPDQDYWEGKLAASTAAGPATIGAALYYSPEFFGETGDATYVEVNGALPLGESKFTVSGALGYQSVDVGVDYTTWNLGLGLGLTDNISLDLRYWDTDEHDALGKLGDSRVVIGVKAAF